MPSPGPRGSSQAPVQLRHRFSGSVSEAGEGLGAELQPCRPAEQAPRTPPAGCVQTTDPSCLAAVTTLDNTAWGTRARKPGLKGGTLLLRREADGPVREAVEGTAPAWMPPATPTGLHKPAQVAWGGGPPGLAGWEAEQESGLLHVLNAGPCIGVGTLLPKAGRPRPEPVSRRGPSPHFCMGLRPAILTWRDSGPGRSPELGARGARTTAPGSHSSGPRDKAHPPVRTPPLSNRRFL